MPNKIERLADSIEDEIDRYKQEYSEKQIEMYEYEMVGRFTERIFELAIDSRDEIIQKHSQECKRMIETMNKYECNRKVWNTLDINCLFSKLNEITEILSDCYFLLLSGRYNTARMTLRKWIELVVISVYFDTTEIDDPDKIKFLKVEDMKSLGFGKKLFDLKNISSSDEIMKLYKKLSLYVHNEGKELGQFLPFYYKEEFEDIYLIINEIQLLLEKMILENCKIDIR